MSQAELAELIRRVVLEVVQELGPSAEGAAATTAAATTTAATAETTETATTAATMTATAAATTAVPDAASSDDAEVRPIWSRGPKHRKLPAPRNIALLERVVEATPARVATGRTGTRYLTDSYLGLRADHAIALDAVESEIKAGWPEGQGWLPLRSSAKDHQEFLLHPDSGRKLDAESRAVCEKQADRDVDLQIIAADGLSASALMENGPPLVAALIEGLSASGFRLGRPLFVKFARIGVQDEIGVLTKARATLIIVGERPGLGTGDSLSIYTAYAPRIGQDNSEKDCISNVRALGFAPLQAAARCVELLERTFHAGGGGVKLAQTSGNSLRHSSR
jgi:ethanolamine ammonia-lyase small subunit